MSQNLILADRQGLCKKSGLQVLAPRPPGLSAPFATSQRAAADPMFPIANWVPGVDDTQARPKLSSAGASQPLWS